MAKSKENISFEENLLKLEEVASDLERGNLTLDEAISKFEEGIKLSKVANEQLDKAEKKINILLEDKNGNFKEEKFVNDEE